MKRLVKKDITDAINNDQTTFLMGRVVGQTLTSRILAEMLDYKNIEQELGIDLVTLFKALKNGVYAKRDDGEITFHLVEHFVPYMKRQLHLRKLPYEIKVACEDYGKTWALTKGELE